MPRTTQLAIASAVVLSGLSAPVSARTLDLSRREPFALAILTPAGRMSTTTAPELERTVAAVLQGTTNLDVTPFTARDLAECRGRLACMVRLVRSERPSPGSGAAGAPRFLLVLSAIPSEHTDYVSAAVIDTEAALAVLSARASDDELEARITERALAVPEEHVEVADAGAFSAFLERLLLERCRAALEAAGHFKPYGGIELSGARAGATVRVQDRDLGSFEPQDAGSLSIAGLSPGRHRVEVRHPEEATFVALVDVLRGQAVALPVVFPPRAGRYQGVREGVFWTGVGVAIAGVAIGTYALASGGVAEVNCWGGADCPSSFRRFGGPGAESRVFEDPAGGGVPIGPLGYSALAAGLSMAGTVWLTGDDRELPWLPVVIGVATGALSFGLSVALDPGSAVTSGGAR